MALIEIVNDANTVLIDDSYSNAALLSKGSVVLTNTFAGSGDAYQTKITATSSDVLMLALELNDIKVVHLTTTRSGNTWTFNLIHLRSYAGRTLNYFLFSIPSNISNAGGMVQLFDANGKIVFDSNLKYMRLSGVYPTKLQNSNNLVANVGSGSYAHISSATCYYNQHMPWGPGAPNPPYQFLDIAATNVFYRTNNSIYSDYVQTDGGIRNSDSTASWIRQIKDGLSMIVDVTNY